MRCADEVMIYGLYDKNGTLVFTGTSKEAANFIDCSTAALRNAHHKKCYLKRKYKVEKLGYEPIKEKRCSRCGKMIPIEKLIWYRRPLDRKLVPGTICKICHSDYQWEWYQKKRALKNNV